MRKSVFILVGIVLIIVCFSIVLLVLRHVQRTPGKLPFPVRVLVFNMFDKELSPWIQHQHFSYNFPVAEVFSDVHCTTQGLCVTMIGEGKAKAATNLTAILNNKQFSFNNSYFLTSGIAGTSPSTGTLGFAAWARWIVDFDHPSPNTIYHLNENLTNVAYQVTKNITLQDSGSAIANRQKYPNQKNQHPYVALCDTITSNRFWIGKQFSVKAKDIVSKLTDGRGTYCTTEQEDTAVAAVLKRFGYVNRYLDLRTASDFDQMYQGETLQHHKSVFPALDIAAENAYLVGSDMAEYLIKKK